MYCFKNLFKIRKVIVFISLYNPIILCGIFVDKNFKPQKKLVIHNSSNAY